MSTIKTLNLANKKLRILENQFNTFLPACSYSAKQQKQPNPNQRLGVELYGTVTHTSAYHSATSKIITALQLILRETTKYFPPHCAELSYLIQCIKEDT